MRCGRGFNPRPRTGGDSTPRGFAYGIMFQSTPPHGGRLHDRWSQPLGAVVAFQSTPPHGGRLSIAANPPEAFEIVSIHAPARGATHSILGLAILSSVQCVSIHAPARGAT